MSSVLVPFFRYLKSSSIRIPESWSRYSLKARALLWRAVPFPAITIPVIVPTISTDTEVSTIKVKPSYCRVITKIVDEEGSHIGIVRYSEGDTTSSPSSKRAVKDLRVLTNLIASSVMEGYTHHRIKVVVVWIKGDACRVHSPSLYSSSAGSNPILTSTALQTRPKVDTSPRVSVTRYTRQGFDSVNDRVRLVRHPPPSLLKGGSRDRPLRLTKPSIVVT
jgi:hypothetical protein